MDESLVVTGPGEQDPLGLHISPSQPGALPRGPRGPRIVPRGGCLMHNNEPHSIPWWPGADFGAVASPVFLPPSRSTVSIAHMWKPSSDQPCSRDVPLCNLCFSTRARTMNMRLLSPCSVDGCLLQVLSSRLSVPIHSLCGSAPDCSVTRRYESKYTG